MPRTSARLIALAVCALAPLMTHAASYESQSTTQDGVDVVRLTDHANNVTVTVAPSIGNMAVSMKVKGHEILYLPRPTLDRLKADPDLGGVPFLAPWANRIDSTSYWANGKKYLLNPDLGNLKFDPNHLPIHGLLAFSPLWTVSKHGSDGHSAFVTSTLEFWKHPELMAQFPFAQTIEMTYRLHDGVLGVETVVHNASTEPLPIAIGFHPYFQLDDAPRDQWQVHLDAKEHLILNDQVVPTGETKPMDLSDPYPLAGHQLDDGFVGLNRDGQGHANFSVKGKSQQITVVYGPKYTVAVVYAPPGHNFICFEPMAALTNGFNLAHDGKWNGLQSAPAGGDWRETFVIRPSGF